MISFDSEKSFENSLFDALTSGMNPINGADSVDCDSQTNFGAYGITDLISISNIDIDGSVIVIDVEVIELKNTPINYSHLGQVARYKTCIDDITVEVDGYDVFINVEYILVGTKTFPVNGDLIYMIQQTDWLTVYEMEIDLLAGVNFTACEGWSRSKRSDNDIDSLRTIIKDCAEQNAEIYKMLNSGKVPKK